MRKEIGISPNVRIRCEAESDENCDKYSSFNNTLGLETKVIKCFPSLQKTTP